MSSLLKKPKMEIEVSDEEEGQNIEEETTAEQIRNEQEEALVALIEHRTKEVEHLRQRINYYKSQLDEAEKRLEDTQTKLARHRGRDVMEFKTNGIKKQVKTERSTSPSQRVGLKSSGDDLNVSRRSDNPLCKNGDSSQSKPRLMIPALIPNMKMKESRNEVTNGSGSNSGAKRKEEKASKTSSKKEVVEAQPKGTKRKLDEKEHKDLIPLIGSRSSPVMIRTQTSSVLSSQHKRKLRSLILCPTNDQLFATNALDGMINLWQVQGRGSGASLLSSTECQSNKQRRWAEDIAWHPEGNRIFSVYAADGGDSQISILNLNKGKEKSRVIFLDEKPHTKGIVNSILFMPWAETSFVTGGSDHAVFLWTEKEQGDGLSWKPKSLHRNFHSSAVMGVSGMRHKQMVMSVGADKRIIGYDVAAGRADYKHQIESKCMSVLTNPCDFNLFMVQTGTPGRQLKLFDLRVRQIDLHAFGWKQESSESQSALINQAWSPDGLYITSGSADPMIHVFDIRYNAKEPSQSIRAHQKRVFKAAWHHTLPLMISISSDLNIGLHNIL